MSEHTELSPDPIDLDPGIAQLISPLDTAMGLRITYADLDEVRASLPVSGNTQPFGYLHGGASAVLTETLASLACYLRVGPEQIGFGVDLHVTHHRKVSSGEIHGVATCIHKGRTMSTYEVVITDDSDHRIATGRLTCAHRDAPGV